MKTFTISDDLNITAFQSAEEAAQGGSPDALLFSSQLELAEISAAWSMSRLVETYNGIPGNSAVRRFADRNKAVARIWAAVQPLANHASQNSQAPEPRPTTARRPAKQSKFRKSSGKAEPAKARQKSKNEDRGPAGSKRAAVLGMLQRANGATLLKIMAATGWQAHTVRGMISTLGSKGGLTIVSSKNSSGERSYRVAD